MDSPWLQCRVGPTLPNSDGTITDRLLRIGRTGELIMAQAFGEYEEMASRGQVYTACNQSVITFGTSLTATAVTFTLYNPVGSLVDLVILQIGITAITQTAAGHIVLAANVNNAAAATTITAANTLTSQNGKLDGSGGYGIAGKAATLPAAPVAIRTVAYGVSAAPTNAFNIVDKVKGAVVLGPNTAVTVQGITFAGTGLISMLWRERPRLAA